MNWLKTKLTKRKFRGIEEDPAIISKFDNLSSDEISLAIEMNPRSVVFVNQLEDCHVYEAAQALPSVLSHLPAMDDASNEIIFNRNKWTFPYIKNPNSNLRMRALRHNGMWLGSIVDPTLEEIHAAIDNEPTAICYVKNSSVELQLYAMNVYLYAYQSIEKPHLEATLEYFAKCHQNRIHELSRLSYSEEEWWKVVTKFPQHYMHMHLTPEQIAYAQICG